MAEHKKVELRIEVGAARMLRDDVAKIATGSILLLDALVQEPVAVYANGRMIGHGELMVIDEKLCVRVTELMTLAARSAAA